MRECESEILVWKYLVCILSSFGTQAYKTLVSKTVITFIVNFCVLSQLLANLWVIIDRYDMWSVGVVILELILGSPNVFQISPLTTALLDQHLEGWDEGLKELAYRFLCSLFPLNNIYLIR